MVSVYSLRRKEPRVKLRTRVTVMITTEGTSGVSIETTTVDVSPHGASIHLDDPLPIGSVVRFAALRYAFATRAAVRSVVPDRAGGYLIGLEYLDETNPIVVWSRAGDPEIVCEPTS
jgi:hypothetical protein